MIEIICAFIAAAAAIYAAYISSSTKKGVNIWKKDYEKTNSKIINDIATIYSELWGLLHNLNADRVYIIQPHPLINYLYISIGLEVVRNGVHKISYNIKSLSMSDVANFCGQLAKQDYVFYDKLEDMDKRAKAIFSVNGTTQLAIKKLVDGQDNWVGSLCIDAMSENKLDLVDNMNYINEVANNIQFILPEYKDVIR